MVHRVRELCSQRFNFVSFVLIALVLVSIPSIDGVWEGDGGGVFRTLAASYVVISAGVLLFATRPSLLRTLGWGCLGAGAFFFVFVSSVWFFWLPVAVGAWVQSIRCAGGSCD